MLIFGVCRLDQAITCGGRGAAGLAAITCGGRGAAGLAAITCGGRGAAGLAAITCGGRGAAGLAAITCGGRGAAGLAAGIPESTCEPVPDQATSAPVAPAAMEIEKALTINEMEITLRILDRSLGIMKWPTDVKTGGVMFAHRKERQPTVSSLTEPCI